MRRIAFLTMICLSLLTAACGGSSDSDDAESATTEAPPVPTATSTVPALESSVAPTVVAPNPAETPEPYDPTVTEADLPDETLLNPGEVILRYSGFVEADFTVNRSITPDIALTYREASGQPGSNFYQPPVYFLSISTGEVIEGARGVHILFRSDQVPGTYAIGRSTMSGFSPEQPELVVLASGIGSGSTLFDKSLQGFLRFEREGEQLTGSFAFSGMSFDLERMTFQGAFGWIEPVLDSPDN